MKVRTFIGGVKDWTSGQIWPYQSILGAAKAPDRIPEKFSFSGGGWIYLYPEKRLFFVPTRHGAFVWEKMREEKISSLREALAVILAGELSVQLLVELKGMSTKEADIFRFEKWPEKAGEIKAGLDLDLLLSCLA